MSKLQKKERRAQRVVRLYKLPDYLGTKQTQNDKLIELGLLRPFSLSPGGRAKVVTEANIAELQEAAQEAGNIDALIRKQQAKRAS
jgi:hypothetical protein